jgi:hypothetical protein
MWRTKDPQSKCGLRRGIRRRRRCMNLSCSNKVRVLGIREKYRKPLYLSYTITRIIISVTSTTAAASSISSASSLRNVVRWYSSRKQGGNCLLERIAYVAF